MMLSFYFRWPGNGQFGHSMSKIVQAIVMTLTTLRDRGPSAVLAITSLGLGYHTFPPHLEHMLGLLKSLFGVVLRMDNDYDR